MSEGRRHRTKVAFILNPAAGHGRAARRWVRAYRYVAAACPDHVVWTTAGPGDGAVLARKALEAGYATLVAVGGDGTLSEVVNGYLDAPDTLRDRAAVATWPAGSGCDFARHIGARPDPQQLATVLSAGTVRRLDVGRVTCRDAMGRQTHRHFLNVAACGLAGEVAAAVQRRGKALGGRLTYLVESLRVIARARPRSIQLVVDGLAEPPTPYHLVALANTSTFGGGMRVAPSADPADGWLDLVTVGAVSRGELLALLTRVRRGRHVGRPGVTLRQARRLQVTGEGSGPLNVDGEAWGELPARFEALPGALRWIGA
jgi:YegS/Rv2252/BmrU family lipid kinase